MALEDRELLSTIVVNNPTDTPVVGQIDLRQAISQANTNGGNETITFDKSVFKTSQTITLDPTLGQLELSDTTGTETIRGPNAGVTVNAGGNSRAFQVDPGVVASISGITITGGSNTGNGGGVYNDGGNLTLSNCRVSGNSASNAASSFGGGLFSFDGTTTLTNCTVSGNSATNGGGIYNQATLNVASSNILNNSATSTGGGIGTTAGTATITNSVVNSNQVNSSGTALGGGIDCENSTLALSNCTVNANQVSGTNAYGGGVYALHSTVDATNCTINGNTANGTVVGDGGGIYASNSTLTLPNTNVKRNKATTGYNNMFPGP
jgi:hypothetical protein